jgi:ATP synthase protein I
MAEQDRPPTAAGSGSSREDADSEARDLVALERIGREVAERRGRQAEADSAGADPRSSQTIGKAWSLAIEMVAAVGVSIFIGWWVDRWFGSAPWGLLGFILLGVATAMWTAIRTGMRMQASQLAAEAADEAAKKKRRG